MNPQIIASLSCALIGLLMSLAPYLVLAEFVRADRCASAVSCTVLVFAAAIRASGPFEESDLFPQLLLSNALAALSGHLLGQACMRLLTTRRPQPYY